MPKPSTKPRAPTGPRYSDPARISNALRGLAGMVGDRVPAERRRLSVARRIVSDERIVMSLEEAEAIVEAFEDRT
jgi:hypothetical protein